MDNTVEGFKSLLRTLVITAIQDLQSPKLLPGGITSTNSIPYILSINRDFLTNIVDIEYLHFAGFTRPKTLNAYIKKLVNNTTID
jgi:hypothetical protein